MKRLLTLFLFCFLLTALKAQTSDSSDKSQRVIYKMSALKDGPALIPLTADEMKEALKEENHATPVRISNLKKPGKQKPVSPVSRSKNEIVTPVLESTDKKPPN